MICEYLSQYDIYCVLDTFSVGFNFFALCVALGGILGCFIGVFISTINKD